MKGDRTLDVGMADIGRRLAVLCPHLNDEVPLTQAAADAGVYVRTARGWLARYRVDGTAGPGRSPRHEAGTRNFV